MKAFHITGYQNRFVGCYIDGSRAVFDTGGLNHNIWVDGFECCAGVGGVDHGIMLLGDNIGGGLVIENNIFCGKFSTHILSLHNRYHLLKLIH